MQCPYCPNEIIGTEEMNVHIMREHPEKTLAGYNENFKKMAANFKTTRIWDTAEKLAETAFFEVPKVKRNKEALLEIFKYYLRELMKSEGGDGR